MSNLMDPVVTIVTPSYNCSRFIKETIASVKAQTFEDWEMIIVDDCSSDNSCEIIEAEAALDSRIKLHRLQKNSGAAVARNTAMNMSRGRYLAFLDSDDLWLPTKLALQLDFMRTQDIGFSFTSYRVMSEEGELTERVIGVVPSINYDTLLKNTIIGCLTVMLDRHKLGQVQMPNIRAKQDTGMWLSILKKGHLAYGLPVELSYYRLVKGSISNNKIKAVYKMWRLYRDVEKLNPFIASWCLTNYVKNAVFKRL